MRPKFVPNVSSYLESLSQRVYTLEQMLRPDATGDLQELNQSLQLSGKGFVKHGADPTVARPTGYTSVEWMGTVKPNNMTTRDTWIDTTKVV